MGRGKNKKNGRNKSGGDGRNKSGGDGRNKSGGNSDSAEWVGKYYILVKSWTSGARSEWFVVDLKQNKIVTKHPQAVWSGNFFRSMAVLHEGTLSVLNIGVDSFIDRTPFAVIFPPPPIPVDEEQDYIHSESDTCISTLDFTVTPPIWSNWKPAPKMIFKRRLPHCVALDNNIFAFNGTRFNSTNPEVYQIGSSSCSFNDKWEKITSIPFGGDLTATDPAWLSIKPISDPNNNRFIAYFCNNDDSLYAYSLGNKKWQLLRHHLSGGCYFKSSVVADQVVLGNLILCYNTDEQIFMAYNIFTNKWLQVDGLFKFDDPRKLNFANQSKLVHLGNDILCLGIQDMEYPPTETVFQFIRFKVKRVKEELVQLTTLSFHPIISDNINIYGLADTFIPF